MKKIYTVLNFIKYFIVILLYQYINLLNNAEAVEIKKIVVFPFVIQKTSKYIDTLQKEILNHLKNEFSFFKEINIIDIDPIFFMDSENKLNNAEYSKSLSFPNIDFLLETGNKLKANYVIFGKYIELKNNFLFEIEVFNINSKKIIQKLSISNKYMDLYSIKNAIHHLVYKIMISIFNCKKIVDLNITLQDHISNYINEKLQNEIKNCLTSFKGFLIREDLISENIKNIYKIGKINNIFVEIKDNKDYENAVNINFICQTTAIIKNIIIKTDKKIFIKSLKNYISNIPNHNINYFGILNDCEQIRNFFIKKGFPYVIVTPKITEDFTKKVTLEFNIIEGNRLYIKNIQFKGNKWFLDENLKNIIKTGEKLFFPCLTGLGLYNPTEFQNDLYQIKLFYKSHGFFDIKIINSEIINDCKTIDINVYLYEGDRFRIGNINIENNFLSKKEKQFLLKIIKVKNKDYFNQAILNRDIMCLSRKMIHLGYLDNNIYVNIKPVKHNKTVNIFYHIDLGKKMILNHIEIDGNIQTKNDFILHYIKFKKGDFLDKLQIEEMYQKLMKTGCFEFVDISIKKNLIKNFQQKDANKQILLKNIDLIDLHINVKEKHAGTFNCGFGFSNIEKIIIIANINQNNLFGKGQKIGLNTSFAKKNYNYEIFFFDPNILQTDISQRYSIWHNNQKYIKFRRRSKGISLTYGYLFNSNLTVFIGCKISNNYLYDVYPHSSIEIRKQSGKNLINSVNFMLSNDTIDNHFFPTEGNKINFLIEYAGGKLKGNAQFTKYTVSYIYFYNLPFGTIFSIKSDLGYINKRISTYKALPLYEKFFVNLRGLKNISPIDLITKDAVGGKTMFSCNLEFLFPILNSTGIYGILFFDSGNTWIKDYNLKDLKKTIGIGLRMESPIGPIRLEWSYFLKNYYLTNIEKKYLLDNRQYFEITFGT